MPPTEHLHNNSNDIIGGPEPRSLGEKQTFSGQSKVPNFTPYPHSEDTTAITDTLPPYAMVCDEAASLQHSTESYTTPHQRQTKSSPCGTSHLDDWNWLPPNSNYDRLLSAKSTQLTHNLICTVPNKQQSCDSPTKATTTQNKYGLPRITNPIQYSRPTQEETQYDTPSTASDMPYTPPTAANHPIRIDNRSCPSRTNTHRNDRFNPNLRITGDPGMDIEPKTSDQGMDLDPPQLPSTMIFD